MRKFLIVALVVLHPCSASGGWWWPWWGDKVTVGGPGSEECRAQFKQIVSNVTEGRVTAFSGSLSQLRELMRLAGVKSFDRQVVSNAIARIMVESSEAGLLGNVSRDLAEVFNNESALSICVLNRKCNFNTGTAALHVSEAHPYKITRMLGGDSDGLKAFVPGVESGRDSKLWQGMLLSVKPIKGNEIALLKNLQNFFHEACHFSDTLLLDRWAKAIQAGAPIHPRLKKFISADGKEVDEGFMRVFMEPRSEIVELQTVLAFYRLSGVPPLAVNAAAIETMPAVLQRALEGIDAYGSVVDGAKRELGIDVKNVLDRSMEIEAWMRSSLP